MKTKNLLTGRSLCFCFGTQTSFFERVKLLRQAETLVKFKSLHEFQDLFGSPSCVRHVCLHYTYTQTDRKTCRARKETIGIEERAKNMFVLVYSTKTLIWPCLIDPHSPFASVRCKQLAQPIVGGPVRVNITLAYNSLFLFFLTTTIRFHFVSGGPNRSMSENRSRQGIPKR